MHIAHYETETENYRSYYGSRQINITKCTFVGNTGNGAAMEILKQTAHVRFVNNSASLAGDAIYGGSFDFCYTLKTFFLNNSYKFYYSVHIFQTIIDMAEQNGPSNISSNPRGVCFCDQVNTAH